MSYLPSLTLDTDPHPSLPLYSAGNFAEVAPPRLSPMSWSLLGPPVERANRNLVSRLWPAATWHSGSHFVFVGYFGCRPYHNLSAYWRVAQDVPLVSGSDVSESYFEDAAPPTASRIRSTGTRLRIAPMARMLRELLGLERRIRSIEGEIADLEHSARAALRSGNPLRLGEILADAREELVAVWDAHYATTIALVPLRVVQRHVGERLVDCWEEVEPWLNRPRQLIWTTLQDAVSLDVPLGPGEFLGHAFYEVADAHEPWRSLSSRDSVAPPGEDARAQAPDLADVVWSIHSRARLGTLPQLTNALTATLGLRETTKSLAMRCLHVLRRLIPEVAGVRGIADEDWAYLSVGELADGPDARQCGERARRRRHECELAFESEPPDRLDLSGYGRDPRQTSDAPARAADSARSAPRSRGVSAGSITGVVVTLASPESASDHPRVLVCESADADVQVLLRSVAGIVTARGSALSHISILAREYGIPAVVGFDGIDELRPGQLVHVDGTIGAVEVVDAN